MLSELRQKTFFWRKFQCTISCVEKWRNLRQKMTFLLQKTFYRIGSWTQSYKTDYANAKILALAYLRLNYAKKWLSDAKISFIGLALGVSFVLNLITYFVFVQCKETCIFRYFFIFSFNCYFLFPNRSRHSENSFPASKPSSTRSENRPKSFCPMRRQSRPNPSSFASKVGTWIENARFEVAPANSWSWNAASCCEKALPWVRSTKPPSTASAEPRITLLDLKPWKMSSRESRPWKKSSIIWYFEFPIQMILGSFIKGCYFTLFMHLLGFQCFNIVQFYLLER